MKLYDEDGIDGPWLKAMGELPRPLTQTEREACWQAAIDDRDRDLAATRARLAEAVGLLDRVYKHHCYTGGGLPVLLVRDIEGLLKPPSMSMRDSPTRERAAQESKP